MIRLILVDVFVIENRHCGKATRGKFSERVDSLDLMTCAHFAARMMQTKNQRMTVAFAACFQAGKSKHQQQQEYAAPPSLFITSSSSRCCCFNNKNQSKYYY